MLLRVWHAPLAAAEPPLGALSLAARFAPSPVPHAVTVAISCSLADLLPVDHAARAVWSARVALGALQGLVAIHATGHAHGWVSPESIVATRTRWTMAWLGPVPQATAHEDLRALGRTFAALDPHGEIGELVGHFADHPPPSAEDAARLLLTTCAGLLARERHLIVARSRAMTHSTRRADLSELAVRLGRALAPPALGETELAGPGGMPLFVSSDGAEVRVRRGTTEPFTVWDHKGLDAHAARVLLRAWASAGTVRPAALAPLMRWVGAASRLRVDLRLLATRTR